MFTDKVGQPIHVGDVIAYGHALGRCAGMRIGMVLKLAVVEPQFSHESPHRITVIGVNDDWERSPPKLLSKSSTLLYPNRTVVIPRERVPFEYLTILDVFRSGYVV